MLSFSARCWLGFWCRLLLSMFRLIWSDHGQCKSSIIRHENDPSKTSSEIVPSVLSGVGFRNLFSHVPEGLPRLEVAFVAWFRL